MLPVTPFVFYISMNINEQQFSKIKLSTAVRCNCLGKNFGEWKKLPPFKLVLPYEVRPGKMSNFRKVFYEEIQDEWTQEFV